MPKIAKPKRIMPRYSSQSSFFLLYGILFSRRIWALLPYCQFEVLLTKLSNWRGRLVWLYLVSKTS